MWKKSSIFFATFMLCLVAVDRSSAQLSQAQASAGAAANGAVSNVAVSNVAIPNVGLPSLNVPNVAPVPIQDPVVKSLADCISNNLQTSQVLAPYNQFAVPNPSDIIFRAGTNYLTKANICDPELAKLDADAAKQLGVLTSKKFFDAVGYTNANFLASQGLATPTNVDYLCLKFVSSIELEACQDGLTDTLSVMNALVYGLYNAYEEYGKTDYESMKTIFQLFGTGLLTV